jgi:hypothetical protein
MVGGTVGKEKLRERSVRAVPQITLGRNRTKYGPKKFSPGVKAYIKNSERSGCEGSAGMYGCGGGTF